MPEKHANARWTPERLTRWAESIGPETARFVERVLSSKEHEEHGFRTILGVLRLAKSYSELRLEAACARANAVGALHYCNVKSILEKNLDQAPLPLDAPPTPPHDNVPGPDYYKKEEDQP